MNSIYVRDFSSGGYMQEYFTPEEFLEEHSNVGGIHSYLNMKINFITVARHDDYANGHWSIILHTDSEMLIQVDLVPLSYRLFFYVNSPIESRPYHFENLILYSHRTVRDVIYLLVDLSIHNNRWAGNAKVPYDCQDFVLAFLSGFGLSDAQCFPYELRRTVTRWRPSLITECDEIERRVFNIHVLKEGY